MSVKDINENSMFDIAKRQATRNLNAVETANRVTVQ